MVHVEVKYVHIVFSHYGSVSGVIKRFENELCVDGELDNNIDEVSKVTNCSSSDLIRHFQFYNPIYSYQNQMIVVVELAGYFNKGLKS